MYTINRLEALVMPLTGKCEIRHTDFRVSRFHYSRIEKKDAHRNKTQIYFNNGFVEKRICENQVCKTNRFVRHDVQKNRLADFQILNKQYADCQVLKKWKCTCPGIEIVDMQIFRHWINGCAALHCIEIVDMQISHH